jgi:hypothetical protein
MAEHFLLDHPVFVARLGGPETAGFDRVIACGAKEAVANPRTRH